MSEGSPEDLDAHRGCFFTFKTFNPCVSAFWLLLFLDANPNKHKTGVELSVNVCPWLCIPDWVLLFWSPAPPCNHDYLRGLRSVANGMSMDFLTIRITG